MHNFAAAITFKQIIKMPFTRSEENVSSDMFGIEPFYLRWVIWSTGTRTTPGDGDLSRSEYRPAWLAEIRRDEGRQQMVHDELLEG